MQENKCDRFGKLFTCRKGDRYRYLVVSLLDFDRCDLENVDSKKGDRDSINLSDRIPFEVYASDRQHCLCNPKHFA